MRPWLALGRGVGWMGLVVLLVGLAACKSEEPKPQWLDDEVSAASENVLWQVTLLSLEKEGFPAGSGLDPAKLVAVSAWRTSLAPFKGDGFREKAEVHIGRAAPGRYTLRVRILKETNEDVIHPMDPSYAKWERASDDVERARILLQRIKSWLGGDYEMKGPGRPARAR
jgi:hypothetical protein